MPKYTIVDVAKLAGTSVPTASRVLSGSNHPVKKSTKENVLKAAKALNYKPNQFSRILKGKHSNSIGVLVPSITNPFYSQIVNEIQKQCYKHGYVSLICSSDNNPELEKAYIDIIEEEKASGILISCINWNEEISRRISELSIPCVLFDQVPENYEKDYVGFDFKAAGAMAVSFLMEEGHQHILFTTGPINRTSRKQFRDGFVTTAEENKISYDILEVEKCSGDFETGQLIAKKILDLKNKPTAIAAINDLTAIGTLTTLIKNGIRIPEDISIIGFDDIPYCSMVTPSLTTIRQSTEQTGEKACEILFSRIKGKKVDNSQICFSPTMVIRDSVYSINNKSLEEIK